MGTHHDSATIITLVSKHYGLAAVTAEPLIGEADINYRLTTEDGTRYTLKISQPDQDRKTIRFQYDLLSYLATKKLSFLVPSPVGDLVELEGGNLLRLLSWVPGRMLDEVNPISKKLRVQWGKTAAELTNALAGFSHPDAPSAYKWNPAQTLDCRPLAMYMPPEKARLANFFWDRFERETLPGLAGLPVAINYNDAHPHNLLVNGAGEIAGVIDFGDAMRTCTLSELAVACAYAGMNTSDPIGAMTEVISGYRQKINEAVSIDHLLGLVVGRLLITVAVAAENAQKEPENDYLQVSAAPAWDLLEKLRTLHPVIINARFAAAYGSLWTGNDSLRQWLKTHPATVIDFAGKTTIKMDLGVGSGDLGNYTNYDDPKLFTRRIARHLENENAGFGYGGYGEIRPVYTTDDFATEGNYGPRWRTVHLGTDIWGPAQTPVLAAYDGHVHMVGVDPTNHGCGNVIILKHQLDGHLFYTFYGHLSAASTAGIRAGTQVQSGDEIAQLGSPAENGGWPPHLHFQVTRHMLDHEVDFPGVAYPADAEAWLWLCPQAMIVPAEQPAAPETWKSHHLDKPAERLLDRRKKHLGYSLSVSYQSPLLIERGRRQYLLDHTGRRYLDTVNNVAHVGHEHPAVVEALQQQAAVLNTNSRYLHENLIRFAEELTATLPPELSVVHFVNSGSEANELALRMCEQWSGTRNMIAVETGYHGNTGRTIDISGYKFAGKGGKGCPPATKIIPMPDTFRGIHRDAENPGQKYAAYARQRIAEWADQGEKLGGFIAESILSCGGQIVLPEGYLREVYREVRTAGGLCIADEVQVGLGRVGSHFWGFELQGVVPDIVTIGKPLGNGHPLAAVVCTPEVAACFANGMEYFNTFGGNPVSCSVGRAVLRVIKEEGLQQHALETGDYLKTQLFSLQARFPLIGDVRGEGLFLGFELIQPSTAPASAHPSAPHDAMSPATKQASYLKNRMRELGFLMSTDGPDENVIKIKPPMSFDRKSADQLIHYLSRVLAEDGCMMP
ncbi:aminotransferase class III-fold pyridoxal phosphate-dependent enzyme [Neolewinella aurantiaca]|uniref:Aminotransferase class III-fold pyridoxal phosphate-dependent enzyme n=1 Tax=Neolewinella aurantiaca TaxID=2602767 RepID=A0A5C7F418_9BACT|nr:aminotransferase class III-fold pyridoxal phosphate-dependent enzyme [Neolewinella aurantiaca]TXF85431.1 aminotransferase class III-fold pyridoxal phosphate-dependent enzyme [Neolewinella aurantiaca]